MKVLFCCSLTFLSVFVCLSPRNLVVERETGQGRTPYVLVRGPDNKCMDPVCAVWCSLIGFKETAGPCGGILSAEGRSSYIFLRGLTSTSCTERGWATHSMLSSCRISSSMCCRASSFTVRFGWTSFCTWTLQTKRETAAWEKSSSAFIFFEEKTTVLHDSRDVKGNCVLCETDSNTWNDATQQQIQTRTEHRPFLWLRGHRGVSEVSV